MNFIEIIEAKRDGKRLTEAQIAEFVRGVKKHTTPDYQISAFLMACYLRGLDDGETAILTREMAFSGETLSFPNMGGAIVDKHSSGGVGDKTTLVVAPICAACGLKIAKMSGRGLGFSGGTLDKLEAIPGFRINLTETEFLDAVKRDGIAVIGQTAELAPVDKALYALRDVTGTVPSIPLIASSIMSKKLAIKSDAIVLDVKFGDGAFMKTLEEAERLAGEMVNIGLSNGRKTCALLTSMAQPLGNAVGNALEVIEAVEALNGRGPSDFTELCISVASVMLVAGGITSALSEARLLCATAVKSGAALEKLRRMVINQGGDVGYIDDTSRFDTGETLEIKAENDGCIKRLSAEIIGRASVELGAGRHSKDAEIDHAVGIVLKKKVGDTVKAGETLCVLHFRGLPDAIADYTRSAYKIGGEKPEKPRIVERIIGL